MGQQDWDKKKNIGAIKKLFTGKTSADLMAALRRTIIEIKNEINYKSIPVNMSAANNYNKKMKY